MTKKANKKKKRIAADSIRERKLSKPAPANRFELKVTKNKKHVLGDRRANQVTRPAASRSAAAKKRESTIVSELVEQKRRNSFRDGRITGKAIVSAGGRLGATETLTHHGMKLTDANGREADSDFEDDPGRSLTAKQTSDNFGGGLLQPSKSHDWKSRLEQLIVGSKQEKVDRQRTREQVLDECEEIDFQWKQLQQVVRQSGNSAKTSVSSETKSSVRTAGSGLPANPVPIISSTATTINSTTPTAATVKPQTNSAPLDVDDTPDEFDQLVTSLKMEAVAPRPAPVVDPTKTPRASSTTSRKDTAASRPQHVSADALEEELYVPPPLPQLLLSQFTAPQEGEEDVLIAGVEEDSTDEADFAEEDDDEMSLEELSARLASSADWSSALTGIATELDPSMRRGNKKRCARVGALLLRLLCSPVDGMEETASLESIHSCLHYLCSRSALLAAETVIQLAAGHADSEDLCQPQLVRLLQISTMLFKVEQKYVFTPLQRVVADTLPRCSTKDMGSIETALKLINWSVKLHPDAFYPECINWLQKFHTSKLTSKASAKLKEKADVLTKKLQQGSGLPGDPAKEYVPLVRPAKRPRGLPSYAPRAPTKKLPKEVLKKQHKILLKSTIREVRLDSRAVASHRLAQQTALDTERRVKTRKILAGLASQEADYKRMKAEAGK